MENKSNSGTWLQDAQIRVLKRSTELGRMLRLEHPEIAGMYKNGESLVGIAKALRLTETHEISLNLAKTAIRKALKGHAGQLNIAPYSGLIEREELAEIAGNHIKMGGEESGMAHHINKTGLFSMSESEKSDAGKKGGATCRDRRVGVHGLTKDQLSALGKKGGKVGGMLTFKKKVGIHALTEDQMRKRALNAAKARGFTVWTTNELEFFTKMPTAPEYQNPISAIRAGKPNWKLITRTINERFHGGRSIRSSHSLFVKYSSVKNSAIDLPS